MLGNSKRSIALLLVALVFVSPALALSGCMPSQSDPAETECTMMPGSGSTRHHSHSRSAERQIRPGSDPCCSMSAPPPNSSTGGVVPSQRVSAENMIAGPETTVVLVVLPSSLLGDEISPPSFAAASQARLCTFLI
jgi:hypothetical protein